ncbi:ABC transporter permease [uncultured Paraglaciecola sp.]|uniref:ABC transporter permease n=1 Tax=uncultured Paraglaciecola sp. TaxID=1765024 RepID=UPI0030DBDC80|tara:strand:+ start:143373 stop:145040 length:1668 start_codon:yes stop_codon:yes gene_type:complete
MAATIRRLAPLVRIPQLALASGWLLVSFISLLPILGIVIGLWPPEQLSFADIKPFLAYQGISISIFMTLFSAIFSTLISLYIAFMVYSQYHNSQRLRSFEKYLAPLLSLPHLAIALGLVFLFSDGSVFFADSGLPRKGLSTLMMAIVIKEVPFFLLIFSAIGRQLPIKYWLIQGKALGYEAYRCWWFLVFPALLKQSRLALLAATAYTLSVVDVSLLVGPNIPELFAVSVYRWQTSFAAGDQALAFWSNVLLLILLAVSVFILYAHEKLAHAGCKALATQGSRFLVGSVNPVFKAWLPILGVLTAIMVVVFALWSLGFNWQGEGLAFKELSMGLWQDEWVFFALPLQNSLLLGVLSALFGVALALLALELQRQTGKFWPDYYWLLAIILPQLSMVLGWQVVHIWSQGSYHSGWIVLSHLPFTFAYAYLVLKGPFQNVDVRFELLAASFGYSVWESWWLVRFRLLLPAVFTAFAIAFSVSIAQYIPTLMIGAGRVTTITTEAVAIGTGSQQDLIALYVLLQSLLPFMAFFIAALLARRFRGSVEMNTKGGEVARDY